MADLHQDVPTRDQIQLRAYELYLKRGGEDGRDVEFARMSCILSVVAKTVETSKTGLPPRPNCATGIRLPEGLTGGTTRCRNPERSRLPAVRKASDNLFSHAPVC